MKKTLLSTLVFALSFSAYAAEKKDKAEGESAIKMEDVNPNKNKVSGDIDEEITNTKMRAEAGSKSKWSLSFTANYLGGSLETPLAENRRNPTNQPVPDPVNVQGLFGGRYRLDKHNSFSFGTGYQLERPLQTADRGYISDPYLSYAYAGKIGPVQSASMILADLATNSNERIYGGTWSATALQTFMYDFGGSKASIGIAFQADYNAYDLKRDTAVTVRDPDGNIKKQTAGDHQSDYDLQAFPVAEYQLTDKVNLRTVFRPWSFRHYNLSRNSDDSVRRNPGFTYGKDPWTQSIGVGYAITRDVFLYPNFQFAWEDWRKDDYNWFRKQTRSNSTVGVNATINIF